MTDKLAMSKAEQMLTWAYNQALSSHGPIDGALELAESYQRADMIPQEGPPML